MFFKKPQLILIFIAVFCCGFYFAEFCPCGDQNLVGGGQRNNFGGKDLLN
jgi:hypothetical protein